MRTNTLEWLACPVAGCHGALDVSGAIRPSLGPDPEVAEGVLECRGCEAEYPVLLGVALLETDLESYLAAFWDEIQACEAAVDQARISRSMRSWLGAPGAHTGLRGPGSHSDPAQQWSTSPYLQAHFDPDSLTGDLANSWWRDAVEGHRGTQDPYAWLLQAAGKVEGGDRDGLAVDVGANVGRGAAALASTYPYSVGVDRSFSAVLAARRLHLGRPEPLDRYWGESERGRWEPRPIDAPAATGNLDFVVASGDALPVGPAGAACIAALNVLCAVPEPAAMIGEFARVLSKGGLLLAASPYWSEPAEPGSPAWDGPEAMRRALAGAFDVQAEEDMVPWLLRLTRRRWNVYLSHCVAATRR